MFTYRLQQRHFKWKGDCKPTFPNDVRVVLFFAPSTPFGDGVGGGRTVTRAAPASSLWNANSDRVTAESQTAFERVNVTWSHPEHELLVRVEGASATIHAKCDTFVELARLVEFLYHLFPIVLNVNFIDAPIVHTVAGTVGDVEYEWIHARTHSNIKPTTTSDQERYVSDACDFLLTLVADTDQRRLAGALHYFHVACRLFDVGPSPWEFTGEIILNLTKTLQALFGQSRDNVRAGLRSLGYTDQEVEDFVIVMELRDVVDSSHVMLSVMDEAGQASDLYTFIYGRELRFRELLSRALQRSKQGNFKVKEHPDLKLDARVRKLFERIRKANASAPMRPPSETA